ncbi:MAG: sel1 repeat family protein [Chromatiales bacterium]|nr:MAG: sel1 repeat family protein [Chromatiales bacterium]
MAELNLPEIEGEFISSDSVAGFNARFANLNPDLLADLSALPDGWVYLVLAECYRAGIVVEKDRIIGNSLLRVAASEGSSQAAHMIASIDVFQSGDPVRQREGFKVLEGEYSESGSAYAAGKLGWAYQQGFGVDQDLEKALELYNFAAERGMTYWQYLLAHAYEKGYLGLEVNEERAKYWREFKPKVHVALYECWVSTYYQDGTFPKSDELGSKYQKKCDETDIAEVWER